MQKRKHSLKWCWSCRFYDRKQLGPHEWKHSCEQGHDELVPFVSNFDCHEFEYEPGTDEEESE